MFDEFPQLLTVQEVADILRVSKRAAYELTYKGHLASYKPKGLRRRLVPKESLMRYMGIEKKRGLFRR